MNPAAQDRTRAMALSATNPEEALAIARRIPDGWFRAQALSGVVRHCSGKVWRRLSEEAREASATSGDDYKVVASGAWLLSALLDRGEVAAAREESARLRERSTTIANPVSRLDALFLLFQAGFRDDVSRHLFLVALIQACSMAHSWKAGAHLRDAAGMLQSNYPEEVEKILSAMPDGKYKRQALSGTADGGTMPRPFFP
jgi:hypothetical protein